MPKIRYLSRTLKEAKVSRAINWFPGHMYAGMQAMMGKLNTVDCVVEVHDARIPFTGRNSELKKQLGTIKPHILVLNKMDLADLSRWSSIKRRLIEQGDKNVLLTDLTNSNFNTTRRGYPTLMDQVVDSINQSDRYNRQDKNFFKVMIVGIPNVGKSTLINRLRQHHLGLGGSPAKTGPIAGVTRHVDNMIKICARPLIYSLDTPGVLQPSSLKDRDEAMRLALCSTVSDAAVNVEQLAQFLLDYLQENENDMYQTYLGIEKPVACLEELIREASLTLAKTEQDKGTPQQLNESIINRVCWHFIRGFRKGCYGQMMLD